MQLSTITSALDRLLGAHAKRWLLLLVCAGLATALVLPLAALGYRFGFWGLGTAFLLFRVSFYAALACAFLLVCSASLSAVARSQKLLTGLGLLAALGAILWLGWQLSAARSVPPIHDITTDLQDPPVYEKVDRGAHANSLERADAEKLATAQRDAYPHLETRYSDLSADEAFSKALELVEKSGWELAHADPDHGTIEATDTTFWFGFKDDVAIRIKATEEGSAIDLRSVSRVGRSDLGKNAARIDAFLSHWP